MEKPRADSSAGAAEVPLPLVAKEEELTGPLMKMTCPSCTAQVPAQMSHCTACGASIAPDPLVGKIFDKRYEVIRRLGAGAMGSVYEVRHLRLKKRFAMKVIHRELTQIPEFLARFEREALSMSRLQHPNCVTVTDYGQAQTGEVHLVMEFLEGKALSEYLDKPLPVGTALEITRQILLGLQHAHQVGIIHRDIKPDNIVRIQSPDGSWHVKVVDFGIAKLGARDSGNAPLTQAGVVFGTPQYMAPEQALGAEVNEQADLYAVGVILWRLLTGRPLFDVDGHMEVLSAKLAQPAPALSSVAPGIFSPALEQLLQRSLERIPSARTKTTEEMLQELARIQAQPGGGLALSPSPAKSAVHQIAALIRAVPDRTAELFTGWYHGPSHSKAAPPPTWPDRLRRLITTTQGAVILGLFLGTLVILLGVTLLLLDGGDAETAGGTPSRPGEAQRYALPTRKERQAKMRAPFPKAAPKVTPKNLHDPLARARLFLAQNACREASIELKNLLNNNPKSAQAHYLLGAALMCRKYYSDGLTSYQMAIELDKAYRQDARILEDVEHLFKVSKLQETALSFSTAHLGQAAIPLLVKTASYNSNRKLRRQAAQAAQKMGAADQVDWLSSYSLDLRQLPSCKERGAAVEKLRRLKNPRAIPILQQARDERTGFWRRSYRNWCIRKQIIRAIIELQGQAAKK